MKILFEPSGEHSSIPAAEVRACLYAYGINFREIEKGNTFIVDARATEKEIRKIGGRLALSYTVNEVVADGTLAEIEDKIKDIDFGAGRSFGIWGRKFRKDASISYLKRKIGGIIEREKNMAVNLKNPDIKINLFVDDRIYVCREIAHVDRKKFEKRKPQYRPFSSPISLHPRIAMALVNLSRIVEGGVLLDPFCGTGGILIEAGMIGAKVVGVDIKGNIIDGCRKNLEYYGIKNYELYNKDATEFDIEEVDAVVSDMPYGRSTYVGKDIDGLYEMAFGKIKEWLKKGSFAVIGLPDRKFIEKGSKYLHLEEVHPMRVHRSLTRYFCVYRNI